MFKKSILVCYLRLQNGIKIMNNKTANSRAKPGSMVGKRTPLFNRKTSKSRSLSPLKKLAGRRLQLNIDANLPAKPRPPLRLLPAFNVTAIILSYYGYNDKSKRLLRRLSKNSRKYFITHKEILKEFFVKWRPEI